MMWLKWKMSKENIKLWNMYTFWNKLKGLWISLISKFEQFTYPWSPFHKHPSASGFMGSVDKLKVYLKIWLSDHRVRLKFVRLCHVFNASSIIAKLCILEQFLVVLNENFISWPQHKSLLHRVSGNTSTFYWDDQLSLRAMHKVFWPRIKADALCRVFTRNNRFLNML